MKCGNQWQNEPSVDYLTGLIVCAECNTQTTVSGVPAMVIACVTPIAMDYMMFVNPFTTNAVKTALIHSWWYVEIIRMHPAQRNSDPPHACISVVNQLTKPFVSLLTLRVRHSQRLHAPLGRWVTSCRTSINSITRFRTE
jgi:hypothetical protein